MREQVYVKKQFFQIDTREYAIEDQEFWSALSMLQRYHLLEKYELYFVHDLKTLRINKKQFLDWKKEMMDQFNDEISKNTFYGLRIVAFK